jgi:four helix bundle protein
MFDGFVEFYELLSSMSWGGRLSKIERFEDIQAWQKARTLVKKVYSVSNFGQFAKDFGLRDQIRRAAVSIMLNIAEGFARKTNREFCPFLAVAHGSAAEVQAALYVAIGQEYVTEKEFNSLYGMSDETSKLVLGFLNYLRKAENSNSSNSSNHKGTP